ncbi:hypothetical protein AB0N93_17335 [Streptomyces sp. NPDC091267]|uniref:hypothetical protein n=1 Tax=unclassified Streptomyces TaxID=2593676 RepID=UPI00341B3294
MTHHHKSNEAVEGDPDNGHSRGMPRRPDEKRLEERLAEDRREARLVEDSGTTDAPGDR